MKSPPLEVFPSIGNLEGGMLTLELLDVEKDGWRGVPPSRLLLLLLSLLLVFLFFASSALDRRLFFSLLRFSLLLLLSDLPSFRLLPESVE